MKRYEYALSFFERFSAAHPAIAAAEVSDYFTGIAHMGDAHPEKAIPIYASISKSSAHVQLADNIIFCYALAEFEVGNYEEATRLLNNFPTQFADSDRIDAALFLAAASRYNEGAVAEAGSQFEKFASLFFTSEFSSRALLFAGLCEERLNHPEIALAFYQRALEGGLAADDRAAALSGQASAFMATGNHFQALAVLGRLSEESQSEAAREYALFWKGRLLYSAGRWTEARNALDKFTNLHPASPFADDALFFSARAARMSNDYWEAVRLFQRLNFLYPNNELSEHAILEAAECKMEAGETELAEEDFKSFAERNVNSPLRSLAFYNMAKILKNSSEFAEALERFRVAACDQTDEMSVKCRLEIASCLVHLGRNDQAVAELVGVVRGAYPPGWAECAHLQVARLLEREGQEEQARQVYDAVARAYPLAAAGAVGQLGIDRLNSEN
jgi:TolA-binding protein